MREGGIGSQLNTSSYVERETCVAGKPVPFSLVYRQRVSQPGPARLHGSLAADTRIVGWAWALAFLIGASLWGLIFLGLRWLLGGFGL